MMKDIPLNDFALEILNEALWFVQDDHYKSVVCGKERNLNDKDADHFTGHDYMRKIMRMGREHNGFPEILTGYSFGIGQLNFAKEASSIAIPEVQQKQEEFLNKIQTTFNLKRNALFSVYPPGGYISWHNNANASAFNLIFTYSETGDGYWEHFDQETKEVTRIPDVKGWQCKAGYFGAYEDSQDKIVYHAARNGKTGLRMTVAFVFDRSEMSQGIQDWVIEDIQA